MRILNTLWALCLACVWTAPLCGQEARLGLSSPYVPGYERTVEGEELRYHSPIPDVDRSLLVRSVVRARDIIWETEPVPASLQRGKVEYVIPAEGNTVVTVNAPDRDSAKTVAEKGIGWETLEKAVQSQ